MRATGDCEISDNAFIRVGFLRGLFSINSQRYLNHFCCPKMSSTDRESQQFDILFVSFCFPCDSDAILIQFCIFGVSCILYSMCWRKFLIKERVVSSENILMQSHILEIPPLPFSDINVKDCFACFQIYIPYIRESEGMMSFQQLLHDYNPHRQRPFHMKCSSGLSMICLCSFGISTLNLWLSSIHPNL